MMVYNGLYHGQYSHFGVNYHIFKKKHIQEYSCIWDTMRLFVWDLLVIGIMKI